MDGQCLATPLQRARSAGTLCWEATPPPPSRRHRASRDATELPTQMGMEAEGSGAREWPPSPKGKTLAPSGPRHVGSLTLTHQCWHSQQREPGSALPRFPLPPESV